MTEVNVEKPKKPLFKRLKNALIAVTALAMVYFSGKSVATGAMENSSPRQVPSIDMESGGYYIEPVKFEWDGKEGSVNQLIFESAATTETEKNNTTCIILPGNNMPSNYAGYVALAQGAVDLPGTCGRAVIAGIPNNAGGKEVDGKNDWGTAEQAAAVAEQIKKEIDLQIAKGQTDININFLTESMGSTAFANSVPYLVDRINQLKAERPELNFNFDIVADSPVLDTTEVIVDGAKRMFPPATYLLEFFARQAIYFHGGEFKNQTPEMTAALINALAKVARIRLALITAEGDTTTRAEKADNFEAALDRDIVYQRLQIPTSSPAGRFHVPGVMYFNHNIQTLDPNAPVSREEYIGYVIDPKAVKNYLDNIFSWDGNTAGKPQRETKPRREKRIDEPVTRKRANRYGVGRTGDNVNNNQYY